MPFWNKWRTKLGKISNDAPTFIQTKKQIVQLPLVVWLVLMLGIILVVVIVQWFWRFQTPSIPDELVSPQTIAAQPTVPLEKLAQLHLFGQNIQQDVNALPETTLQLTLKGIYSSPNQDTGSAIIAVPGQADKVYLKGDTLPGGAVLMDIHEDRVILRRAGQLEVLMLPKRQLEVRNQ